MTKFSSIFDIRKAAVFLVLVNLLCFNHILEVRNEEPRRAIVTIEMMESGDFIAPQIYAEPYYNKPPLYNWVLAGSFSIFGTSEWALRLPGVLSFLMIGFLLYRFCRKEFTEDTAMLIAFGFLTSGDLLFFGTINAGEIDLFYSLVVVIQALLIYKYGKEGKYLQLFIYTYLLTAVGVLTKGIPSLAFQALTLLGYFIVYKKFWKLFSWQHFMGIGVFAGLMASYFWYYSQNNDLNAFLSQQFKEASQRTGNEYGMGETIKQFLIFPLTLIEKMFPWSLLAIGLFSKDVRQYFKDHPIAKFSLIFIAANIIIYWTAPHLRIRYIFMFFPFILIIILGNLDKIKWESKLMKVPIYIYLVGIGGVGLGMIVLPFIPNISSVFAICVGVILFGIMVVVTYKAIKIRGQRKMLWYLVFALLIGRLGYNLMVLPAMSVLNPDLNYRTFVDEIVDKAAGRPVYLSGVPDIIEPDIQLFGKVLYQDQIIYPPSIPFQIPYYYAHKTDDIIRYQALPEDREAVYLMFERDLSLVGEPVNYLYEFEANNTNLQVVLFDFNVD